MALEDDDVVITLTEKGYDRLREIEIREKSCAERGRLWGIIDEQSEKLFLLKKDYKTLEQTNETLQNIIHDLSIRSGIIVINPAVKNRRRAKSD